MTARTAMFLHLGGPFDGENASVEVDDQDVPVEIHYMQSIGMPDGTINPAYAIQSMDVVNVYERESDFGPDGMRWVYRYRGTDEIDVNNWKAA